MIEQIDLSTVFLNFWHGQVRKNLSLPLESKSTISKITKFESDLLKTNEDIHVALERHTEF